MSAGRRARGRSIAFAVLLAACSNGGNNNHDTVLEPPATPPPGSRESRAISGVSMGAYGAMNLGTKHVDLFGAIGSLGGPVDMAILIDDMVSQNLEVKPLSGIPSGPTADYTFDLLPDFPDRDSRLSFVRDLVLAFGNPVLHHPDPDHAYLASDSEPAHLLADDEWGTFTIPSDPNGFADGGDKNADGLREVNEPPDEATEVLLVARGSLQSKFGIAGTDVGGRFLADTNADGIYDIGDGIVVNLSEPFTDNNGNGIYEPLLGETFQDVGLDGVPGTGDRGEGNGTFDRDPDLDRWFAEDPKTRLENESAMMIQRQRIYMDVGDEDELGFARHYASIVNVLTAKGIPVDQHTGFTGSCAQFPHIDAPFTLIIYHGGHVGFAGVGSIDDDLRNGDVCGPATIWQRFTHLLAAMDSAFANPDRGLDGPRPTGDTKTVDIASPALAPAGGAAPMRRVVVYRPPAFFNSNNKFPILYFLPGHGQAPEDFERAGLLLDTLIAAGALQNMYVAFLPGAGGTEGSFYVNHAVSEAQVPGLTTVTSGRYEDSIVNDLIPAIEIDVL
jgi:enterochelin esterase-like enzyme